MPVAGFSSHHSLSCPVCKVGKTVNNGRLSRQMVRMHFLLIKYCNFTVKHHSRALSVQTHGYPLVFWMLGEHPSASPHQLGPGAICPVPCAWHRHRLPPSRSCRKPLSNKGDWLAVCPTGPQPSCWCDTGARGTWPVSTRTT